VADDAIRCDACPVLCYIKPGRTGSCDRYGNHDGKLVRLDPHVVLDRALERGESVVPFLERAGEWDGTLVSHGETFVTAIGAGTTYPDYKPAPFIISSQMEGVDMVTVVTEGIFSYCGVKVKIDTDRHLGGECSTVRAQGQAVGHVTTSEYGSQMLSLGGVRHLTGGSRQEGTATSAPVLGNAFDAFYYRAFLVGPGFFTGLANGVILGYLMYRSELVPRGMTWLGLIGGPLIMITGILVILNAIPARGTAQSLAGGVEGLWELSLSIYCIIKGFRLSSPILRTLTLPESESALRHQA